MSDNCPTCGQVLPWKKSKITPTPVPTSTESKSNFHIIPPVDKTPEEAEARVLKIKEMKKHAKLCECWLCGTRMSIHKYADHMQKHRDENWVPRPVNIPNRDAILVFAEWQQQDA